MAIISSEISYRLSGGGSNAVAAASLGGAKSSTAITTATLNNLFDNVSGDEAAAGDTEYRCIYVHNGNATLTWEAVTVWIDTNTPATGTDASIGLGSSAVGGTEQTVANENTAPTSVTFTQPANKAGGLVIGDIAAGSHKAIWIKRVVTAGAAAYNADSLIIKAEGDTAA
jgi:hypothetical protein